MHRRHWLKQTTVGLAGLAIPYHSFRMKPELIETKVVSRLPDKYHGWPTLTRRKNGDLLLVCSGGRVAHVCPFGRVDLMRSHDGGATWTFPETVMDGPIDDRDAGVLETSRGTLLVTSFSSLAYEPTLAGMGEGDSRRDSWMAAHRRVSDAQRKKALGVWMIRSTDDGLTWSRRFDSVVNSPHGPVALSDGSLLYAGKDLWRTQRIGVARSTDDGLSWTWQSEIPTRSGDRGTDYHELHAVECKSGRLVAQIRNHNRTSHRETLQCKSTDGGATWSTPRSIGVWGLPSHLLRLSDGRLLMSYGYRRKPYGNQARLSEDEGRSWSDPITISGDGMGGDLGYPSTIQRDDGVLVTVWYERMASSKLAVLRQATWRL